uniref:Uncharacterized protein n=1 Tax=Quercus lobata TaxID=97700 RepID=A0A7N2MW13_QUELO
MEIKKVNSFDRDLKTLFGPRGGRTLEDLPDLAWSVSLGFDQSILIWHLATEICHFQGYMSTIKIKAPANKVTGEREPKDANSEKGLLRQRCNYLSRYMLYLLVKHPNMLPIGINIKFHSIYAGIGDFIEKQRDVKDITLEHASETLSKVSSEFMIAVDERDISNFVMFHACKLASALGPGEEKWEIITNVWLEMLCHAAGQLRRGGELLTHAWLLMAHFGLTDHFQIPSSPAIAEAILR